MNISAPGRRPVPARRGLRVAVVVGVSLTLAACGSSGPRATAPEEPAASSTGAVVDTTPAAPVAVPPRVAPASVAPAPTEESSVRLFGQDGVDSAYAELVELATVLSFNPEWTLHDVDNQVSDLDPVLAGRYHQNQADYIRAQAEACGGADDDACADVVAQVYYDMALSAEDDSALAYRPDGEFVTEQAVTNPTVTTNNIEGTDGLHVEFDHTATLRFLSHGAPVTATLARHVSYDLWQAPAGNAAPWWIVNWGIDYHGEVVDEATGQQLA